MLSPSPALPDVGTPCLLADSVQVQPAERLLQASVLTTLGNIRLEPLGETQTPAGMGAG